MAKTKPRQTAKAAGRDREFWAHLALRHTPGIGPRSLKKILSGFPTAFDAVTAAPAWPSMRLASEAVSKSFGSRAWEEDARAEHEAAAKLKMAYLLYTDEDYPARLRELPDPPPILYYRGDTTLMGGPVVAVVGSRQGTTAGLAAARTIAAGFSRAGICVASGLALGIDRAAHLGALTGPGSSIAVLGTGLDVIYPPRNEDLFMALSGQGLIVSEFGPGTPALPPNFPVRNRIMAGLSLAVVVVEAPERSGSLITARLAMEQGAEVFAVPGPMDAPFHKGCHALINQGAHLFESVEKALVELAPALGLYAGRAPRPAMAGGNPSPARAKAAKPARPVEEATPEDLTPAEAAVWKAVPQGEAKHIDVLTRELSLDSAGASRALLGLEVRGLVRKLTGMYYTRN